MQPCLKAAAGCHRPARGCAPRCCRHRRRRRSPAAAGRWRLRPRRPAGSRPPAGARWPGAGGRLAAADHDVAHPRAERIRQRGSDRQRAVPDVAQRGRGQMLAGQAACHTHPGALAQRQAVERHVEQCADLQRHIVPGLGAQVGGRQTAEQCPAPLQPGLAGDPCPHGVQHQVPVGGLRRDLQHPLALDRLDAELCQRQFLPGQPGDPPGRQRRARRHRGEGRHRGRLGPRARQRAGGAQQQGQQGRAHRGTIGQGRWRLAC
jgi:hypothetical protein